MATPFYSNFPLPDAGDSFRRAETNRAEGLFREIRTGVLGWIEDAKE
jgi:hypothetical protein